MKIYTDFYKCPIGGFVNYSIDLSDYVYSVKSLNLFCEKCEFESIEIIPPASQTISKQGVTIKLSNILSFRIKRIDNGILCFYVWERVKSLNLRAKSDFIQSRKTFKNGTRLTCKRIK